MKKFILACLLLLNTVMAMAQTVSGSASNNGCQNSGIVIASASADLTPTPVQYQLLLGTTVVAPVSGDATQFTNNATFSGLAPGTYTLKGRSASGGTIYTSGSIVVTDGFTTLGVTTPTKVNQCIGGSSVLTTTATGGKAPFVYKISTSAAPSTYLETSASTSSRTYSFAALPTGSYLVSVTDACGQTITAATSISDRTITVNDLVITNSESYVRGTGCTTPMNISTQIGSTGTPLTATTAAYFTYQYKYQGVLYGQNPLGGTIPVAGGAGFPLIAGGNSRTAPTDWTKAGVIADIANMKLVISDGCGNTKELQLKVPTSTIIVSNCGGSGFINYGIGSPLLCYPFNATFTNVSNPTDTWTYIWNSASGTFSSNLTAGQTYNLTYSDGNGATTGYNFATTTYTVPTTSSYNPGPWFSGSSSTYLGYGNFGISLTPYLSTDIITYTITASPNTTLVPVPYSNTVAINTLSPSFGGSQLMYLPGHPNSPGTGLWPKGNYTISITSPCGTKSFNFTVNGLALTITGNTITPKCGGFDYVMNGTFDNTSYEVIIISGPTNVGVIRGMASLTASLPFAGLGYGTYVFGIRAAGATTILSQETVTYGASNVIVVDNANTGGYVCTAGASNGVLTISAVSNSPTQNGGNVLQYALSTDGGVTYGAYQSSNVFTGLAAGTYSFKVKDGCLNEITQTAQIGVAATPTATADGVASPAVVCQKTSGTIQLNVDVSGASSYLWTGPGITAANQGLKNPTVNYTSLSVGANNYTCAITLGAPCNTTSTTNLTITVNAAPNVVITNPAAVCSPSSVNLTAAAVTAGSDAGLTYTYFTDAAATSTLATPAAVTTSGTYYIKATNSNGCTTVSPVTVTINPLPSAGISYTGSPFCKTGTKAVAQFGTTGGTYTSDAGLSINASTGLIDLAASTAGAHTITYSFTNGTCSSTTTATITINALPAAPTTSVTQPLCGATTGTITVTAPTTGVTYSFDNGATYQASATSSALASGTYQVMVKNSTSGCISTATATVINAAPVVPTAPTTSVTQPICSLVTGTIAVTAPTTGVTYSFDNGVSYQSGSTKSGLAAGATYQVMVKDNTSGCASAATATVIDAAPSVPTAPTTSVTQPICGATTGTITVTAPTTGVTYSFDNGVSYQASATSSALASGTYQVIVKDNTSSCASAATATVINATPVVPTAPTTSVTQPTCSLPTGTITVTAPASGVTYSFDNGATYQASSTKSGLAAGATYQVMVKDNTSSCASSATATVINAAPSVLTAPTTSVTQPTCSLATGTIVVTAPTSGVTYSFDNGATYQAGSTKSGLAAGATYQVMVKDNTSGCASAATATVINTAPSVPTAPTTSVTQPICGATTGTITVTAPTTGVTYSFDNGVSYQASATSSALASGTYQVIVKDNTSGCASAATATVINAAPIVPTAPTTSVTQPTCSLATGTITVTAPTTGVTYSFDNGATYQASSTKSGLAAGATYQVMVKDNTSSCASSATATVINAAPSVLTAPTTSVTQPICGATTGTITVTAPTTGVTYSFDNGVSYQASATSSALASGTYQVIVKDNTSGCASAATATVINAAPIVPTAPTTSVTQPTCSLSTGTITVTAPTTGVTYSFDNGATYQASSTKSGLAAGTYQVIVKDNTSGCASAATATVISAAPSLPTAPISTGDKVFCAGDMIPTISATVGTGETIDWYDASTGGNELSTNATTFLGTQAGTYYAEARNTTTGCKSATRTAVTVSQNALPTLSVSSTVCSADLTTYTITFTSNGTVTSSVGTVSGNTVTGIAAGTNATLTATSTAGCQTTLPVTAPNCACPTVNAPISGGNQTTTCVGAAIPSISASVGTNETIDWYDASTGGNVLSSSSTSYQATQVGTYYAETRNTITGCKSATRTAVTVSQNALPTLSLSSTTCSANLTTYTITFTSNGTVTSTAGTVSGNTVTGIAAGTNATLTATSTAGCQTTLPVTAPNCACPTVNAPISGGNQTTTCVGAAIPSISASVGTNETIDWYDASTGGNVLSSSSTSYQATQVGTYYAETRNTITGCKSATRTAVTVSQNALPTLSLSSTTCSANLTTYTITFTSNGTVTSTAGTVSGNTVTGIAAGTNATLTATSTAGCQTTLAVTAPSCACPTVNAPISGGDQTTTCVGAAIPSISASAGTNETIDWYDASTGGNVLSSSSTSYQATQVGTYYAETRNTITGCKSATRTAVTVSQNALPTLSVSSTTCSANLTTYTITFTSNGTVTSSVGTVLGNTVTGIAAGTNATLTATSTAGCQTTLAVTAPSCACPTVNAPISGGNQTTTCVGAAIPSISASAGTNETIDWYDASTGGNVLSSSSTSYQATQAGTYYAETRNTITGCKSATRTAVTVSQNALPTLSVSSTTCSANLTTYTITFTSNGTVTSTAGTVSGNTVTGIAAGTNVTLTATSTAGCQTTLAVTAPSCACPTVNAPISGGDQTTTCVGAAIPSISASVGTNETIDWYDASTGGNVLASSSTSYQATQAGTYYAETRNTITGCKSATRTAVTVQINSLPTIALSTTPTCALNIKTYSLGFSSNGSVSASSGIVSGSSVSGIPTGTDVTLTATSSAGCQSSLVVTAPTCLPCVLNVNADVTTITQGQSTTLHATGCAGTFGWQGTGKEGTDIVVNPLTTTTYTGACWFDAGAPQCTADITITVTPCQLTATATKETISQGESVTLTAFGCQNGTLGWVDSNSELATITVKPFVTTTYTAKCWYTGGAESCSISKTITVTPCQLTATATKETISQGESVTLTAFGCQNGTLGWVDSKSELATITVKPFVTTTYTAKCWYTGGGESCSISKTITVTPCQLTATATKETISQGESVTLTASGCGSGTLGWVDSKSELATITVKPFVTTTYTAKCWYTGGGESCSISKTITVTPCQLTATATKETISQGESVTLTAFGCQNGTLGWVDSKSELATITVKPFVTTTYTAKCWYTGGGESCSISKTITVIPCQLTATATKETISQGESVTLTASGCGSGTLIWADSKSVLATTTLKPLVTTTYTAKCLYGGTESCSISKTITVKPCQLSAIVSSYKIAQGDSVLLSGQGCYGSFAWQGQTKEGSSVWVKPLLTTTYTGACWYESGAPACSLPITIEVQPCHLKTSVNANQLVLGEKLQLTSTGCLGKLIYPNDTTQNGNSVFTYLPTKTQNFTIQCKIGQTINCDTTIKIVVEPCHLQAKASKGTLVTGETLSITSTGCIGTLIYAQDTTQNGKSVFTYVPMKSQKFSIQCKVGNIISCDTTMNIEVAPCHLQAKASKGTLVTGETLSITSTGCVGTLVYVQDVTQNGKSVFSYVPMKSQSFTVQCKVGTVISCDTTINIVVSPCHLQARAEKAVLVGGESLKITSTGCIGTLIYPSDVTQNGKSVFSYLPTKSQSFTIQCKVGEIISCDTTISVVVDKCPSVIQATATTIVKGDYTTISYKGCPNTVVWKDLGTGLSKNVSPAKTTTYYASCNYGDKLQYTCSSDSIIIKVRPKQPIIDDKRSGSSGIAIQDTICLNTNLVLGINCDVDAKSYWNGKQLNELTVDATQAGTQTYRFYCQNVDGDNSDESTAQIVVKGFEVEDAIIYPVPTAGLLHIKTKGCLDNLRLTLFTLSGQLLYQGNGESRTSDSISIDLTFLPSNEYVLHISGMQGNEPMTKRVRIIKYSK